MMLGKDTVARACIKFGLGLSGILVAAAATMTPAVAHGAAPKKIEEEVDIAAKPDVVWGLIKDFAKISTWNPAVVKHRRIRPRSRPRNASWS